MNGSHQNCEAGGKTCNATALKFVLLQKDKGNWGKEKRPNYAHSLDGAEMEFCSFGIVIPIIPSSIKMGWIMGIAMQPLEGHMFPFLD